MITLISLAGVAIGVMVLAVVLSVFGGFEQLVKERVLGYTPHINIRYLSDWSIQEEDPEFNAEEAWRAVERSMSAQEGVESAYALINDYVLLDRSSAVAPAYMQAIDTSNKAQLDSLQKLIQPGMGNADMDMGDRAVVSSLTAERFGIVVGDVIQVHTNRNLQQVQPVLNRIGEPGFAETHAEELQQIRKNFDRLITIKDGRATAPIDEMTEFYYNILNPLLDLNIRGSEREVIGNILDLLLDNERSTTKPDESGVFIYPAGHKEAILKELDSLANIETDKADVSDIKNIKTFVLPKDLEVVGIYQATRHAPGPDIFVPLAVGQDLAGLGAGVKGIALRLDDPYKAAELLEKVILPNMPQDGLWDARTWMQDHQQQFGLIKMQRQLLTFALAFIMLVSAFSIMAVMFTVTLQKKREIGVMKALGAAPHQIVFVFLYQGIIIGLLGGLLGIGLGYVVLINRQVILDFLSNQLGFNPFPSDFNGFDGLPAIMNPTEFLLVFLFAFVMCVLATFVPAMVASRSDAAKSLRNM